MCVTVCDGVCMYVLHVPHMHLEAKEYVLLLQILVSQDSHSLKWTGR